MTSSALCRLARYFSFDGSGHYPDIITLQKGHRRAAGTPRGKKSGLHQIRQSIVTGWHSADIPWTNLSCGRTLSYCESDKLMSEVTKSGAIRQLVTLPATCQSAARKG